jgi:SAM-dependent methyltransferase
LDCGTGNGQAARELVNHFDRVVAADASAGQLSHAVTHPRIDYLIALAEDNCLKSQSVDLVTVAVAVHWFDLERFYETVRRILVSNGVLAVWTYHMPEIEPGIDRVLLQYYRDVLADYWPEQIRYVDACYRTLPFPFDMLQSPDFTLETDWDMGQFLGFLESWSATQRYRQERGENPLRLIFQELSEIWGDQDRRRGVRWSLYLKVGRV